MTKEISASFHTQVCTLKPYERSMRNYSSAKLELLALKWAMCEKFKDYLIGSRFTVLTDNNLLTYVRMSRLGAAANLLAL